MTMRLNTARTILAIEAAVARSMSATSDPRHWIIDGVECLHSRHVYSGPAHAFTLDVSELRCRATRDRSWHLFVVTERWRGAGETGADLRTNHWLKLVEGRPGDVIDWIRLFDVSQRDDASKPEPKRKKR